MSTLAPKPISPPPERISEEVEVILGSAVLKASEPLRKLLRFLAAHSLDNSQPPAREQAIAGAVFNRLDFDSKIDSVVRVQTGRLRSKLAEYYMGEGSESNVVLEIPKGGYTLSAHFRVPFTVEADAPAQPSVQPSTQALWIVTGSLVCVLIIALAARTIYAKGSALESLWKPFAKGGEDVLVVFSNPRFVGQATTGLKLYDPSFPAPGWFNETYTGTGDAVAIHEITRTLTMMQKRIILRRARQLGWEEAKNRNVIFIGAPIQNSPSGELHLRHFAFEILNGRTQIANLKPAPGEQKTYTGAGPPFTSDYCLVARVPSFNPAQTALILAGTTTLGTQAAAEFVSREESVAELLGKLGLRHNDSVPPFEALLQVRITEGVALESHLLIVRRVQ